MRAINRRVWNVKLIHVIFQKKKKMTTVKVEALHTFKFYNIEVWSIGSFSLELTAVQILPREQKIASEPNGGGNTIVKFFFSASQNILQNTAHFAPSAFHTQIVDRISSTLQISRACSISLVTVYYALRCAQ